MDYEHDDRRAADVPGATGAEGSGLPAGREPRDADLLSSRSPEVRAFDPHLGSGSDPSELTESGQADDLFDAMFLTGGLRPPAFAAMDHDLGFPPPQGPDLASAFLAALDAIDDRRFVTPVPEESLAPVAPAPPLETAATGEPSYELRPQSRLDLESEGTPESVDETPAQPVVAEDAARLPWDTGRVPVAGLLVSGEIAGERVTEPEPAAESASEPAPAAHAAESADERRGRSRPISNPNPICRRARRQLRRRSKKRAPRKTLKNPQPRQRAQPPHQSHRLPSFEDAELIDEPLEAFENPIEEAAYYAAGLDGDAGDADEAEAVAVVAAEADAEDEAVAAAAAQADADAEAAAAAADAEAVAEAEALARALAEAEAEDEQAAIEAAIAAEAALDEASNGAPAGSFAASVVSAASAGFADASDETAEEASEEEASEEAVAGAFDAISAAEFGAGSGSGTPAFDASAATSSNGSLDAALDASLEDDEFDMAFDALALDATPDAAAPAAALAADLTPGDDDDFGLRTVDRHGADGRGADGVERPDAFAVAPVAAELEPEPESDELEDLQDYVVFSLGDMRCVVPIRNVVEVGRIPDAAPVPNAPAWLYAPRQPAWTGALADRSPRLLRRRPHQGVGGTHGGAARRFGRHHRWRDGRSGASDRGALAVALQGSARGGCRCRRNRPSSCGARVITATTR